MGLPPLEYIDCFLDSPTFREVITLYEKELDGNAVLVKSLVKECRRMIQATEEFSRVQQSFAQSLSNFNFQTIGEQTEDEKMIVYSLQTFAQLLFNIEDCRHNMVSTISVRLLQTLERFRKEQIQKARDEKKRFEKASERYYVALEKHLALSPKKKDFTLAEMDSSLERELAGFRQSAFDYVCKLQDVHAQKQYELIEPIVGYIRDVSTFLHQAYDSAFSIKPEVDAVEFKVTILREIHEKEQEKVYQLKAQVIEEGEAGLVHHPEFLQQGHLFVQDARKVLGQGWHRYFCQFRKRKRGSRQMKLIPIGHHGLLPSQDFMDVQDCVRSKTEDVERRFCFEVELITPKESRRYTVQSLTAEGRKGWLEIMEGREPVYSSLRVIEVGGVTPRGVVFVQKCIDAIEERGLDEEGLYREPGVLSKAMKLIIKDALERGKVYPLDFSDEFEWDTKMLTSAVKEYFGKQLGEPLLTFAFHEGFIEAAKIPDHEKRIETLRDLVDLLPDDNKKLLVLVVEHLKRISAHSSRNLMKASNLGVVFGPMLMRPERESITSTVDIKYQNIIVEIMISEMEKIFPGTNLFALERKQDSRGHVRPPDVTPSRSSASTPPEAHTKKVSAMFEKKALGTPPSHKPPPRPVPPLPANPNIPPPITQRQSGLIQSTSSSQSHSRSPEPYETPRTVNYDSESQQKKSLQEELVQQREEATQTRQQLQELQQKLDGATAEKKSLQEQLVQQREDGTQTRQQVRQLQQRLDDAATEKESLQEQLVQQTEEGTQTRQQVLQLQQRLHDALAASEQSRQRLDIASSELHGLQDIEPWKVSRDKVEIWTEIGSGGWGSVSEGTLRVAIKKLHHQILSPHYVDRLQREMRMLAQVRHPNLVQFLGVVLDEAALRLQEPPMIITELLDVNLRNAYERKLGFNKLSVFQDVARALKYLHERHDPIIHRDVSAPNVLLEALPNGMWKGKVSDLGSANLAKLARTLAEGAIIYAAPETLPQFAHQAHGPRSAPPPQTTKIDVYSYGVLLCEVVTSQFPDPAQYHDMLGQVQREWPFMYELILSCTQHNPVERPTMAKVLTNLLQQ